MYRIEYFIIQQKILLIKVVKCLIVKIKNRKKIPRHYLIEFQYYKAENQVL